MERARGLERYAVHRDEQVEVICERYDVDTDAWVAWDLSSASLSVVARAYVRASAGGAITAVAASATLAKVGGGTTGHALGYLRFSVARSLVECEVVVVDADVVNAATISGFREIQVRVWEARVEQAVVDA